MKQSGHLNPSEVTGTGCPVTSKYGRTPPNKHGGVGRKQQHLKETFSDLLKIEIFILVFNGEYKQHVLN